MLVLVVEVWRSITNVDFINNSGEFLFKSSVSNDITIDTVNIDSNDIQNGIMTVIANDGIFTMQSTNITNNNYNGVDAIASLVNITSIGSVTMSQVNVKHNKAIQYLIFDKSTFIGDFNMINVDIMDNINTNSLVNDILIQVNSLITTVVQSYFHVC